MGSILNTKVFWSVFMASLYTSGASAALIPERIDEALLKTRLNTLFSENFHDEALQYSVQVYSLSKQKVLYTKNGAQELSPASAIKLLTGYIAMKALGPSHTFQTTVLTDGRIERGTLYGDLYLRGGGDPTLVTERLYLLASEVARKGIQRVMGRLYVDASIFDEELFLQDRIPAKTDRPYAAPISGLSLNYNSFIVFYEPGKAIGQFPRVSIDPPSNYVQVLNQARTSRKNGPMNLQLKKNPFAFGDQVAVSGQIPVGLGEQKSTLSVQNPPLYAGEVFRSLLAQNGVQWVGTQARKPAEIKKTPPHAKEWARHESLPLRDIVVLMNKFSNNLIADSLIKYLGYYYTGKPGSMDNGLSVLQRQLHQISSLYFGNLKIVSGSGLTRLNKMSAIQFTTLLNHIYKEYDLFPELMVSMPIAGFDGTLRKWNPEHPSVGLLRGKTGSLDGVSSLVGILRSNKGELIAYAVLVNDSKSTPGLGRPWQNDFARYLTQFE